MSDELKACPFCGNKIIIEDEEWGIYWWQSRRR
jgi:hypothetical protein